MNDLPEIETFDCIVKVDGMLPNEFALWPPRLQDQVMAQVDGMNDERRAAGKSRLMVARVNCSRDHDQGGWYAHIILQPARFVEKWEGPAPEPKGHRK